MPIDPVKIPQNVHIEDRIVGPLTLRQIIISMLGIGFSYALWASISKVYGGVPLHITIIVWIPAVIALMFAFIRVNDLSMTHLLLLLIERMEKPQTRIWGPRRGITLSTRSFATPTAENARQPTSPDNSADLSNLSDLLDTTSDPETDDTIPASDDIQGLALPPRPVQKDRITIEPLTNAALRDVHDASDRPMLKDILSHTPQHD